MMEKREGKAEPGQAKGVVLDEEEILVEEFCSLVAEIAARLLTRGCEEPDNGGSNETRR